MKKILVVDDAKFMRNILRQIFEATDYEVVEASTADEGLSQYKKEKPDIVTMDICMPKKSGIEAIKEIMAVDKGARILVCSALGQELMVMEAVKAGAKDFIIKPFKKEQILETLDKVIES